MRAPGAREYSPSCALRVYDWDTMRTRNLLLVVVVASCLVPVAGCGGLGKSDCPNGSCAVVCSGDTFASGSNCTPFTVCPAGTYVALAGTATSDQICDVCANGSYSTGPNSVVCTPWLACLPGSYVNNVPSATANRVCSLCGSGTYTGGINESVCLSAAQCPAGTVETAPSTPTAPHVCTPCSTGEYCAGGREPAVACLGDKWDDDASPTTACVAKTTCPPGTSVARSGSAAADRVCAPCTSGTFSVTENAAGCSNWNTCFPGEYVTNFPSANTDRQCAPCAADTYTELPNQSVCLLVNDCPAGTAETSPGTATSKPECSDCTKGQYCPGGSTPAKTCSPQTWDHDGNPVTACVLWSLCTAGSYVAIPGSATSDQFCLPCPDGTFSTTADSIDCSAWSYCPAGMYVSSPPNAQTDRSCAECPDQTFSAQENQHYCVPWSSCPDRTVFQSSAGTAWSDVVCSPCSDNGCGHFCTETGACVDCLSYTDCASGLACVNGTCKDLGCGGGSYFAESFASANANWWTIDSPWDIGPGVPWTGGTVEKNTEPDPTTDHSPGDDNMMAGVVIGGIAPQQLTDGRRYLTSAAIDISQGPSPVYLEFYRWLNSDFPPFMSNLVEVFDGGQWVTLWSGPPSGTLLAENGWSYQVYNITAYRNPYFRVRFGYVIEDADVSAVSSWNIDDIRIANTLTCTP